jgi:hypothetical protein
MSVKGGADQSHKIKSAAKAAGISSRTLQRSRDRLNIETESVGFPRCTYWLMPGVDLPEVS